jgi:hypothetical protein
MTTTETPAKTNFSADDYARKIDGLLSKAAQAGTAEEAEAFTKKAQELMSKYAIDEAMVAEAAGKKSKSMTIIEDSIVYLGSYSRAHYQIGHVIAQANECRTLITKGGFNVDKGKYDQYMMTLHVIGFEEDVKRVKMLNSALQIQAQGALNRWWKGLEHTNLMSAMQKYKDRRQFLLSFANGLHIQLTNAAEAARKRAEEERGSDNSVALVLRDKKSRVDEWVDQTYGRLRSVWPREYGGTTAAAQAGKAAGLRADAGTSGRVAGANAGALPRG